MKFSENQKQCENNLGIPSVRVPRAETRLMVYRSPSVRMLSQLVGFGPVERASVKFTKKCMLLMKTVM